MPAQVVSAPGAEGVGPPVSREPGILPGGDPGLEAAVCGGKAANGVFDTCGIDKGMPVMAVDIYLCFVGCYGISAYLTEEELFIILILLPLITAHIKISIKTVGLFEENSEAVINTVT